MQYVSPATAMLVRRRQMLELQQQLSEQQAVYAKKDKELIAREQAFRKKDVEFQDHLIRFARFLQDSDAKMARANKKARNEVKLQQKLDGELEQLGRDMIELKANREQLRVDVQETVRFRDFLESCCLLEGAGFYDISGIFVRHAAATSATAGIAAEQQQCKCDAAAERGSVAHFVQQKSDEAEELRKSIAALKAELNPNGAASHQPPSAVGLG